MSKDITRLNEEKVKNVAFKAKVLGEMLDKIKQSVSEIEEGKPHPLPPKVIEQAQPLVAKKFAHRDTAPYYQHSGVQDRHFPPTAELSYDNYLAAILDRSDAFEYNFTFSNG